MRLPFNLERHPARASTYIAYDANGFAFRVERCFPGWRARPSHSGKDQDARAFRADTLRAVAELVGQSKAVAS